MFSGGDYHEVARWLKNFLTSHVKREHPRIEVALATDEHGVTYTATLSLGERTAPPLECAFAEVAAHRGELAWCNALAERTRALAREHLLARRPAEPQRR